MTKKADGPEPSGHHVLKRPAVGTVLPREGFVLTMQDGHKYEDVNELRHTVNTVDGTGEIAFKNSAGSFTTVDAEQVVGVDWGSTATKDKLDLDIKALEETLTHMKAQRAALN